MDYYQEQLTAKSYGNCEVNARTNLNSTQRLQIDQLHHAGNNPNNEAGCRKLLMILTKFRTVQTLGSTLAQQGAYENAYRLYLKTVNSVLCTDLRSVFSIHHINLLEKVKKEAEKISGYVDRTWILRSSIDYVYDACINNYNSVKSNNPSEWNLFVKNAITVGSKIITSGNKLGGLEKYVYALNTIQRSEEAMQLLSAGGKLTICQTLSELENCMDIDECISKARQRLELLYSEIRLPHIYQDSVMPAEDLTLEMQKRSHVLLDFRQENDSLRQYVIHIMNDQIMNGRSHSFAELNQSEQLLKFNGTLSRYNRGGFASVRIVPTDKTALTQNLSGMKGIIIEARNLERTNNRYKFQLANESHLKSFSWQSEFVVEPNNEFQSFYLDILSFWPNMFGHVLTGPGKVDTTKVDCMGVMISRITVDGKESPDFVEGPFALGIRTISIVTGDINDY